MKKIYWLLLGLSLLYPLTNVTAQRLTVGAGNISGTNLVGPFFTRNAIKSFSVYAFIYPAVSLPGMLHGDTIEAIDFQRNGPDVSIPGKGTCRIWISNIGKNDFGAGNINFQAEILNINAPLVYNNDPLGAIGSFSGFSKFTLDTKYGYDTTKGKNLAIFIEYSQDSFPSSEIFWNADNASPSTGYTNNQVKFVRDTGTANFPTTSNTSSSVHPQIRLDIPRSDFEGTIIIPYTYGKIPVPMGNPDTLKLRVTNLGKKDAVGFKAYVNSKGANFFDDSVTMPILPKFEEVVFKFPTRNISNLGLDTLLFELPADSSPLNNKRNHYRLATKGTYSYRDVTEPLSPGGIGFNQSTGNFVAKFSSQGQKPINQITVNFAFAGNPFRVGIWESNEATGRPGKLLWQSDSLTSTQVSTIPVSPFIKVIGNFYVGVRQLGLGNVSFAYQLEQPIRERTFFYSAPLADTNWIDFAPDAPFRFMIEPRVQEDFDITVVSIDSPKMNDTIDYYNFDTIRPSATIYNLGAENIDTPITIKCQMYIGNKLILSVERKDTFKSGSAKQIIFDTAFVPPFTGNYRMLIYPVFPPDQATENDSAEINFVVAYYNDVGPDLVINPFSYQRFEYKRDTLTPLYRIRNYAYNDQFNFLTRTKIISKKGIVDYESTTLVPELKAGSSLLITEKKYPTNVFDTFNLEAITELSTERDPSYDTLSVPFIVIKSHDVSTDEITIPKNNASYDYKIPMPAPKITVSNLGLIGESEIQSYLTIKDSKDKTLYSDTINYSLFFGQTRILTFIDTVKLPARGRYYAQAISQLVNDFETINDTANAEFFYGYERDASADTILLPDANLVYELNTGNYAPRAKVSNVGYDSLRNTAVRLEGIKDSTLFYISSRSISLDSNQSDLLDFDNTLQFSKDGIVQLRLITLLDKDQNSSNDTFIQNYIVQKSNDVGINKFIEPAENENLPSLSVLYPTIEIENYGLKKQLGGFDVNCKILGPKGTIVYNETLSITLDSAEKEIVTFSKPYLLVDTGAYVISARALLPTDQLLTNDLATSNFIVYYASNNALSTVFPQENIRYIPHQYSDTIRPSIHITKTGTDNIPDTGKAYIRLQALNTNYLYFDSISFSLPNNMDTILRFNKTYNSNIKDSFKADIWITSIYDGFRLDDSLSFNYAVQFAVNIDQINDFFSIGPNPGTGKFFLNFKQGFNPEKISVFDQLGRLVYNANPSTELPTMEINIGHLPDGIYFLLLNDYQVKLIKAGKN